MKRTLLWAAIGVIAPLAFAGPEILPISGINYLTYNEATGEISPASGWERYGHSVWAATQMSGYFYPSTACEIVLDWGDIAGPVNIGGFGFSEFTNAQDSYGNAWGVIMIYAEENGWNSTGRVAIVGFLIDNIPTSTHPPDEYWGYIWYVEPVEPFVIDGSDLDGDGLVDFGYSFWFSVNTPGAVMGPAIAFFDPDTAPGADEWYDLFDVCPPDEGYVGTYSLGPNRQLYWEMFAPGCPNRGASGRYCSADIDGSFDCIVGLADLAQLLANYPMTTGATLLDGDVDPYDYWFPGDGDVDLGDLAELLSQYGDDCNWP